MIWMGIEQELYSIAQMENYREDHRRRMNTEARAKVVAAVWGTECIQFLATPAILN